MEEKVVCETYLSIPKINEEMQKLNELKAKQKAMNDILAGNIKKLTDESKHSLEEIAKIIKVTDRQLFRYRTGMSEVPALVLYNLCIEYDLLSECKKEVTKNIISMLDEKYSKKPIKILSANKNVEYYGWIKYFSEINEARVRVLLFPYNERAKVAINDYTYDMSKIVFVSDDEINDYIVKAVQNSILWNV